MICQGRANTSKRHSAPYVVGVFHERNRFLDRFGQAIIYPLAGSTKDIGRGYFQGFA